jgi:hypothetical protein
VSKVWAADIVDKVTEFFGESEKDFVFVVDGF